MDLRRAIRKAVVAKLTGDAALKSLAGDPLQLRYRPSRKIGDFSDTKKVALTFFDSTSDQDETVPLFDRQLQVDVWTTDSLDLAERVAARVQFLLEPQPGDTGLTLAMTTSPNDEGLVAHLHLGQVVDSTEYDADLTHVSMTFRMLVYQYPEGNA